MSSDLLQIGLSGTRAARAALEVSSQNIANASTDGYVRRSINTKEVSSSGGVLRQGDISLSGVRVAGVDRNADMFRQAEVRRTTSESSRAQTELVGLENIEAAIEQARTYDLTVEFEASLRSLASDPTDPSLRAAVIAASDNMASGYNLASDSLNAAGEGARFEAVAQVEEVNQLTTELGRVNLRLARAGENSSDQASLLDQRDLMLEQLSEKIDIRASFDQNGIVEVTLGGEVLVDVGTVSAFTTSVQTDGTLDFAVDGVAVDVEGGSIAGKSLILEGVAARKNELDALALGVMNTVNLAQGTGSDQSGAAGQPWFSGTGAGDLAVVITGGGAIATAALGAASGSTEQSNLTSLRDAFNVNGHAQNLSDLIFSVSSEVAGKQITSDALGAIASTARIALDEQSGVDLDQEAANLVRYQQAFQASGRAMQVATELFDTLLGIG